MQTTNRKDLQLQQALPLTAKHLSKVDEPSPLHIKNSDGGFARLEIREYAWSRHLLNLDPTDKTPDMDN